MSESLKTVGVGDPELASPEWDLFICYRQVDGRDAAAWLHSTLSGRVLPFIPEGFTEAPRLRVYFDQAAPAVDDWTRLHKPALSRARALLFVCSPGAYARLGNDDWVHQELDWWIENRAAAPILIDPTGDGSRWVPASVSQRWPNAQRLLLQLAQWDRLPHDERAAAEANLRDRIIGGIRESERSTTYQDLEREKQRAREFERQAQALRTQRTRLRIYFISAVVALILAAAAALIAVRQQRATESQAMQTRASLALATAASVRDPLAAAMLLINADDILNARSLPVPPGAEAIAHRIARLPRPKALMRHTDRVTSASFSPDGHRIVTSSFDRTARIWNADGLGTPITLSGHEGVVYSAEFSPAGDRVVTASADGTARIWNAADGSVVSVLRGHQRWVLSAAFSADGKRVVTASLDQTARIWSVHESKPPIVLAGHEAGLRMAAFDHSGDRVVTASDDGTARIWRTDGTQREPITQFEVPGSSTPSTDGSVITYLARQRSSVITASFSPDGKQVIASAGAPGAVIWNTDRPEEPYWRSASERDSHVDWCWFSPDGRLAASGSSDGLTRVWKPGTDEALALVGSRTSLVGEVMLGGRVKPRVWSPDGQRVLGMSPDGTVTVSRLDGAEPLVLLQGAAVTSAEFSADGAQVVSTAADGTVRVWDAKQGLEPVVLEGHTEWVSAASFSPDGRRFATVSDDRTARLWDVEDPRRPVVLGDHTGPVRYVAFSRDGKRVVTASMDGMLRIWDVESARVIATLGDMKNPIGGVVFSPDTRRAIASTERGLADNTLMLWDLETRTPKLLRRFQKEHWPPIFSSDGNRVLVGFSDGSVRAWDVNGDGEPVTMASDRAGAITAQISPTGSAILTLMKDGSLNLRQLGSQTETPLVGVVGPLTPDQSELDFGLSFSPQGNRMVVSERSGRLRIWQSPQTRHPVTLWVAGTARTLFSPDGTHVVAMDIGRPSRIWSLDAGGEPLELDDGRIGVGVAVFSPDGSRLVTIADKSVRLWRVRWRTLLDFLRGTTNACLAPQQRVQWMAETAEAANTAAANCEERLRSAIPASQPTKR